jgi:lipopolysaccharide transport system ATP-binding protein
MIRTSKLDITFPIFEKSSRTLRSTLAAPKKEYGEGRIRKFRALRGITLTIDEGDRVGLLGHNGAGKSTFLRTLAGIYEPTGGSLEIRGEIKTMFEIGTGLDLDATGYENIPLIAAANQIRVRDMPALIEDVEAFTELDEALDRPMRTYSTGMRMRLAFAVTTAFPSDILLMDEVIGVGDNAFREKSRQRVEQMIHEAGTLILASHSSAFLRTYCTRGLVFKAGEVAFDGPIEEAIAIAAT